MIAKRLPWKPEYATNAELFWSDLDKFSKQFEIREQGEVRALSTEEYVNRTDADPRDYMPELLGFIHVTEDERRQYIKSLLGVD